MKKRKFGSFHWKVSEIGLGTWAMGGGWGKQSEQESISTILKAVEQGIDFIDTAQIYGDGKSEKLIGKGLKLLGNPSSIKIASKIPPLQGYWPPHSYENCADRYPEKYLRESVEKSLSHLRIDCLDLMQLHTWNRAWNKNPEALEVLHALKKEGKIKAVGISTPEQDQNACNDLIKEGRIDSLQVIYNIFDQEASAEIFDLAMQHEVAIIVRCALDEGSLTGKFSKKTQFEKGDWRKNFFRGDRLKEVVKRVEKIKKDLETINPKSSENLASTALKFILREKAVSTVITGARNSSQIESNASSSESKALTDLEFERLLKHAWRRYFW